jgi:hypothetical protein
MKYIIRRRRVFSMEVTRGVAHTRIPIPRSSYLEILHQVLRTNSLDGKWQAIICVLFHCFSLALSRDVDYNWRRW